MKLYIYSMDGYENNKGITECICEAEEKPNTYFIEDDGFWYHSRIRKEDIGCFKNNRIILTEPDFEYAKNKFIEVLENRIKMAEISLNSLKNKLKSINESVRVDK